MSDCKTPWEDRTPEQRAARWALLKRAEASVACRQMQLLHGLIRVALQVAEEFDADHDGECACDYCRGLDCEGYLRFHAHGLTWGLQVIGEAIRSDLYPFPDEPAGILADLRDLTRLAEGIEADRPAEADTPAVVG